MSAGERLIQGVMREAVTSALVISYEEHGVAGGRTVVLLHGFPYDPRAFDAVARSLAYNGCRVIIPYLRGHGPTRFLDDGGPRSGEQAALGNDLIELIDVLDLRDVILAGYDWGGRAACIAAAMRPDRVAGLVTGNGYNIFGKSSRYSRFDPAQMHRLWYAYCLQSDAGAGAFASDPAAFNRYLWSLWSPDWRFDDATFARSAPSFANPDYARVVIHSYRHRAGVGDGDPVVAGLATRLADEPLIEVPTFVLHGASDMVQPPDAAWQRNALLRDVVGRQILPGVGHNLPQEAPEAVTAAIRALMA